MLKESSTSLKSFKKLTRERYSCGLGASKSLNKWLRVQDYTEVSGIEIIAYAVYKQSGRPKLDQQPDSYEYRIMAQLYSSLTQCEERLREKGMFMLATNDCSETLTMEKTLEL